MELDSLAFGRLETSDLNRPFPGNADIPATGCRVPILGSPHTEGAHPRHAFVFVARVDTTDPNLAPAS